MPRASGVYSDIRYYTTIEHKMCTRTTSLYCNTRKFRHAEARSKWGAGEREKKREALKRERKKKRASERERDRERETERERERQKERKRSTCTH